MVAKIDINEADLNENARAFDGGSFKGHSPSADTQAARHRSASADLRKRRIWIRPCRWFLCLRSKTPAHASERARPAFLHAKYIRQSVCIYHLKKYVDEIKYGRRWIPTNWYRSISTWLVDVERCSSDPSAAPVWYIFKWGALFLPARVPIRLISKKSGVRARFARPLVPSTPLSFWKKGHCWLQHIFLCLQFGTTKSKDSALMVAIYRWINIEILYNRKKSWWYPNEWMIKINFNQTHNILMSDSIII